MATRHLSIRVDKQVLESLDAESRRTGQTRSQLAKTLLIEGLRMQRHPGILFRSGPAGRRPALMNGPDVWEVARLFTRLDESGEALLERTAEMTGLTPEQVRAVLRYYAEFTDEVDEWIARAEAEAIRAEEAWLREDELLQR
jgi:hypothetical protein